MRDGTVGESEDADVVDAAAVAEVAQDRVVRDGTVGEGERADVGDAAAVAGATGAAIRRIVRDGAVGESEGADVVDEAIGSIAVIESETGNGNGDLWYYENCINVLATTDREDICTWADNFQVLRKSQITARQ